MEKPILEVELWNELHLQELIENHEVYGQPLITLIKFLAQEHYECKGHYCNTSFEEDFILRFMGAPLKA